MVAGFMGSNSQKSIDNRLTTCYNLNCQNETTRNQAMLSIFKVTYVNVFGAAREFITLASSEEHARKLFLDNVYGVRKIVYVIEKP